MAEYPWVVFAFDPAMMTALRDSAASSPHPTDKIAAQIWYQDGSYDPARTNARPDSVTARDIPLTTKIADRSLYVHAETMAFIHATKPLHDAVLLISDPFCPNCAKQIALAGIKKVIIDGEGFAKIYHRKNEIAFRALSLSIADYFGVDVFVMDDTGGLIQLHAMTQVINGMHAMPDKASVPVAEASFWCKTMSAHGLAFRSNDFTVKYDHTVDAGTRALLKIVRKGCRPDQEGVVTLSRWPGTPRPFIDLLGAGLTRYVIKKGPAPEWAGQLSELGITIIPR